MLGGHSPASVALAAALGIPVYITTEASLPMVAALVHGGLGLGPAMAFLVTGAGTSIGAITGAFVIARARVIGLIVALLFAGALILGWLTGATLWLTRHTSQHNGLSRGAQRAAAEVPGGRAVDGGLADAAADGAGG